MVKLIFMIIVQSVSLYHSCILSIAAIAGETNPSKICLKNNEVYTTCGTACPLTCDNYNNPPTACTRQCIIGCVCKPGYVKNKAGDCVLPCDCKPEGKYFKWFKSLCDAMKPEF